MNALFLLAVFHSFFGFETNPLKNFFSLWVKSYPLPIENI